jgi:hypothetical protein
MRVILLVVSWLLYLLLFCLLYYLTYIVVSLWQMLKHMYNNVSILSGYTQYRFKTIGGGKIKMRFIINLQNNILGPNP